MKANKVFLESIKIWIVFLFLGYRKLLGAFQVAQW